MSELAGLGLTDKAKVLVEALPWLRQFNGATVVVKYGGNAMVSEELRQSFARDVLFLYRVGLRPVVVHGGGPQISGMLGRLGIESEFRGGLRVTTPETMDVVRMVLSGKVQRDLVGLINRKEAVAVGISGDDGAMLRARRTPAYVDGEAVDVGRVGDVVEVDARPVRDLLAAGRVPVVSTIATDMDRPGEVLNVNADTAASAIAVALGAQKLVVLTDVEGLFPDWPSRERMISHLGVSAAEAMLPGMDSGMIPKLEACTRAVRGGVSQAHMVDGRVEHSMLLEIFTAEGIGTMVLPDREVPEIRYTERGE